MRYLSESCPEMSDPRRYPTKRVEDAKGTFHWSLHTRSHWDKSRRKSATVSKCGIFTEPLIRTNTEERY